MAATNTERDLSPRADGPDSVCESSALVPAHSPTPNACSDHKSPTAAPSPTPSRCERVSSYVVLLVAFLSVTSLGTASDMLTEVTPLCKAVWRVQGVFGGFAVALVGQAVWRHINKITSEWPTLDRSTLAEVFVFCLGYSVWVNSFFIALKYASVLDVYLFNQSHVIYVLLFRIIACKRLPWQQYAALVVIGGGLYLSLSGNSSPLGIAIAAGGGAFAVPYIANAAPLQKKFGLVPVILMSQLSVLLVSVGVDGVGLLVGAEAQISWSRPFNPVNGFFGWTTAAQDHIWIWAYLVVVCGFMGMAAYTYAATKLPSLIIHAVMLVEPGMASVESTLMHTGLEPGLETWVGMAVITLGCCVVMIMDDAHHGHQADPDDHRGPAKAPKLVGVDGGEAVSEQHSLLRADSEAVYGSFDSSTPSERDSTVSPV